MHRCTKQMKRIENLEVTVTYHAGYCDIEVPDDIYNALMNLQGPVSCGDTRLTDEERKALEWLAENVKDSDANNWEVEIDDIE